MIATLKANKSANRVENGRVNNRMTFSSVSTNKANMDTEKYANNGTATQAETKQSKFFNKFKNRLSNRRSASADLSSGHEISQPVLVGHQNAQQIIADLAKENICCKPLPEIRVVSDNESENSTEEEGVQVVIRAERASQVCHFLPQSEDNNNLSKSIPANFAATLILNNLPTPPTPILKSETLRLDTTTSAPPLPKRNPSRISNSNQIKLAFEKEPPVPNFLHSRSKSSPFFGGYESKLVSPVSSSSSNTPPSFTSNLADEGFNSNNDKARIFFNSSSEDDLSLTQLAQLKHDQCISKDKLKESGFHSPISSEEDGCGCDRDEEFKKMQQEVIRLKIQNNLLAKELLKTKKLLTKANQVH